MKKILLLMIFFGLGATACKQDSVRPGRSNRAPTVGRVFIESANAYYAASTIPASVKAVTDPENDTVTLAFQWYVNDAPVDGASATFLESGVAVKGDVVKAEVTPRDEYHAGVPVFSNVVTLANTPPNLPQATLSPDPVTFAGQQVAVILESVGDDDDGDTLVYRYRWHRNNASMGFAANLDEIQIVGRTGDVWQVRVSASDGDASSAELFLETYVDRYEMASSNFILVGQAYSGLEGVMSAGTKVLARSAGSDGAAISGPRAISLNFQIESSFND